MDRFREKTCIVTGGARGIGSAIATRLGTEGCTVAIFDIDEQAGQYRQRELEKNGIKAVFYKVDVASEEMVKQAVEDFYGKHGRIDILVNNAGIGFSGKGIEEQTLEEWRRIIDTNLTGTWLCTKHVVTYMKKTGGVIINIASTRAFQSEPNTEPYSASKGGIIALTHALAVSLAKYHIRVISISPGWVDTSHWQVPPRQPQLTPLDHEWHPAGRVGKPEDIAALVAFLASDDAQWITGTNITIDGGVTTKMFYPDLDQIQRLLATLLQDEETAQTLIKLAEKLHTNKDILREIRNKYLSTS
ncbi:SDR family oxidoreductase [Thermofilum sp.]|jgi:NAD(P)-dependent dehydrogenase (short-subunit alcohol dehydrogenase family)|uniref:SDR family oxidoreductase n=1 Tax=Thermofilum sp. TaxID=1961369 RepID=UPI00258B018D|nr:SDR family oxidoreductase [Thermofilum sp.]